jgi:hypothetical protein
LENHGPGNNREDTEQDQNRAGDPAGLCKDVAKIGDKQRGEQENDAAPRLRKNFSYFWNVAHAHRSVKRN